MSDQSTEASVPTEETLLPRNSRQTLATIQEALSGLRYGQVTVVVHNGVVVQVERLEKKRLSIE